MRETRERVLALERILNEKPQRTPELMRKLKNWYNIECGRKSIYQDIAVLTRYMPICMSREGYWIEEGGAE